MKSEQSNTNEKGMAYDRLLCTGLNDAAKQIHEDAKRKGFWDSERETGTLLMLCVSELSEALEADRKGRYADLQAYNECEKADDIFESDKRAMANDLKYNVGVIHSNPQLILEESFISGIKYGQSSPKIKQLEWDFYRVYYSARTPIGEYAIREDVNYYGISNNNGCILTYNGIPLGKSHLVFDNAKAAAQADFERRVKECLDM